MSFIWLSGGLKPDHKTISNFRRDHKKVLINVLKQCARICLKLKLIEGNILFVDGSKFRANAGNRQTKSKETWEKIKSHVEERIEELMDECQKSDQKESEHLVEMSKELKSNERLKTKIEALVKELNDEESVNGTDPDCRIMKGRQGSHASYNGQMVVDEQHGLIVSMDVSSAGNDLNQLDEQISQAEEALEKSCDVASADAGYSSVNDLKKLVEKGRKVIVPNTGQVAKNPKNDPFAKKEFHYDSETDRYNCPEGSKLYPFSEKGNRVQYQMNDGALCASCKHFGRCTTSKKGRSISRLKNEETKELLEKIYESDEGQEIYSKRKMKAELPFGHLKRNLGAGYFLMRGNEGAKAEFSLLGSCFNIARMLTILGGVRPIIEKLQELRLT